MTAKFDCFSIGKMESEKRVFLIHPVRGITEDERIDIEKYVKDWEDSGAKVYVPMRDTQQDDPIGVRICTDNRAGLENATEVHIWWNGKSEGSLFDFGMAFALRKAIVLANPEDVPGTDGRKSFNNVLRALAGL